jgi:hypothetical protein
VKDRHKEKRILFEIKHGKLDGYIQKKKTCAKTPVQDRKMDKMNKLIKRRKEKD